jgi:transglutaminase-like putative cysteine protease
MATDAARFGAPGAAPREAPATGPLASPGIARLVGFFPLALFGALQWGQLLAPSAGGAMLVAVIAATGAGGLLIATGGDERRHVRAAGAIGAVVGLLLMGLLVAGVPLRLLKPANWDELASGIGQGVESMPAITVPYRGVDEWVRTAIVASGAWLAGAAALIAFWPRPKQRTPGHSIAGAVALGALYTIPIVESGPRAPYLDGAVLCVLLATYLWLERLRADQVGVAFACVLAVAVVGGFIAPRLDGSSPWLDYEQIAEDLQPEKAVTFNWNHVYGPMTWPRDGREVLRVKAPRQTYWKIVNLDEFDGLRWIDSGRVQSVVDTELKHRNWIETISVVDRGIRSREFVGAGHMIGVLPGGPPSVQIEPGTFQTIRDPLTPGSSYKARVYVPRPTDRQLRTAGTRYPPFASTYLSIDLPRTQSRTDAHAVDFAPYGSPVPAGADFGSGFQAGGGAKALRASPYARVYALAQTLKAQTKTPFQFVQAVLARVQNGATYSESPPPARVPLVDFLFNARLGYCQQFSGAMALLLRMGGVPARVASGFSPGRFDPKRNEYVVRDDDAHSWVEAYFPGIGWQTFDPTPAASPARSQIDDLGPNGPTQPARRPDLGLGQAGDRPFALGDPGARLAKRSGPPWLLLGGLAAVLVLALAAAIVLARRGRIPGGALAPELAELQRALHRTGRTPATATTLTALERTLGGSDAAVGYLRAIRAHRYGGAPGGPSADQRRALRRELASGLGWGGRLRAWWALPPVVGRHGPYTGSDGPR